VKKSAFMFRGGRKGFTLLEALFAVLIVAILAAIAVPMYANTKKQSAKDTCMSNIRAIATAESKYKFENGGYTNNAASELINQGLAETPKCPTGAAYKLDTTTVAGECTITCLDASSYSHSTDATMKMVLK
jgi:prepilin-type N-terminal cleavage/methylation domain-containing protein